MLKNGGAMVRNQMSLPYFWLGESINCVTINQITKQCNTTKLKKERDPSKIKKNGVERQTSIWFVETVY